MEHWHKHKIEVDQLQKFYEDYIKVIRKGEAKLEDCYCIWKYKDSPLIYMHALIDFLNGYKAITEFLPVEEFYFCQPKFK
jgi:hypothetical protein